MYMHGSRFTSVSPVEMSTASKAKLRRLNQLRRAVPHVSASALSSILDEVNEQGVPEVHSKSSIRRATDNALDGDTPYGKIIKQRNVNMEAGGVSPLLIVCTLAMVWTVVHEGGCFANLLLDALSRSRNSFDHHGI